MRSSRHFKRHYKVNQQEFELQFSDAFRMPRTSMMQHFCEDSERLKAVNYFR